MEHFKWNSFYDYLKEQGLTEATDEIIEVARKEYRKMYMRYYRATSQKRQFNLFVSHDQLKKLTKKAKKHSMRNPQAYVHHLIDSDSDKKQHAPNFLIDLELKIIQSIDSIARIMKANPRTRGMLIETYKQLEEILIIVTQ